METLLSQQLQQAWLDIQMRKKQQEHPHLPDPSSPSSTSCANGTSPPQKQYLPSPSSLNSSSSSAPVSNRDQVSAFSIASVPPEQPQQGSDEDHVSFQDPVLQYINDILMEEEMEDHTCMMLECISYHATAKGFYDIIATKSVNDRSSVRGDLAELVDEQSRVFENPANQGNDCVGVSAHDGYGWMDDMASIAPESDRAVAVTESPGTSSLDKSLHSCLQNHDINFHASDKGMGAKQDLFPPLIMTPTCYDASLHSGSSFLPLPSYDSRPDTTTETSRQCSPIFRLDEANSRVSDGIIPGKPFRKLVSDSLVRHGNNARHASNGSKFKRAASQVDSAAVGARQWPHSTMSVQGSIDPSMNLGKEEAVSYVQNKDLNAEGCASVLNNGLASMVGEVSKSPPGSIPEGDSGTRNSGKTVDLKGLLVGCAQAVAAHDIHKAHEILQKIRHHASPYGSSEERLAHYFAEGLVARLSCTGGLLYTAFTNNAPSAAKMLKAHHLFVEVCPFVKLSHYFANKAILEVAEGASRLHIVDYGILYGLQWPCLISALTQRRGGPPHLRITGIDFPRPGIEPAERVEMTGRRLSEYAKTYGVPFEYHAVASKWETIHPSSLHLKEDEVLVVNSMFRLRHLLDETVLASNPRKTVLGKIRALNPKIFVQGVKSASYNTPFFMSRFLDALTFFSYNFDLMDSTTKSDNQERMMIEREVLGRDIVNVVACEGPERVERPETYKQWENRTRRAGFEQSPLNQNILKEAQDIVRATYDKNFSVDQDGHWMLLGWKGQALHGLTVWKPNGHK